MSKNLTGVGLYTVNEASRYTRAQPREIRRWLFGYKFKAPGKKRSSFSPPLWTPQVADLDALGFHDLLELRVVKEFIQRGVHLRVVRTALANARQLFGTDYPFTAHRFLTDGKRVFHEAMEVESPLTDMASKQIVFETIIRPSLYAGIVYGKDGSARRWFPVPRSKVIVLDPALCFGAPALAEYGVPVDTIAAAVSVEKSAARVARMYNIPAAAVRSAVDFEHRLAA